MANWQALISVAVATIAAALLAPAANAQPADTDYPSRTVKIVVSAPAGGGLDIAARIIADKLRQHLGQPFIVENRPGAAGNTGAEAVAAADPDGYTLLAAQPSPLTVNQLLYRKLNFDPAAFMPVAIMTAVPNVLVVRPDFPASSLREFIAHARANPGRLNFASQGIGTTPHLSGELFNRLAGTELVHVPYKGTAQAVNDVVAGHVDLMFLEMGSAFALYEGGLPEFKSDTWNAVVAPPRTSSVVVGKLNAAINDVLALPDVQAHFAGISMQPVGGAPADLANLISAETRRWGEVIRAANISAN